MIKKSFELIKSHIILFILIILVLVGAIGSNIYENKEMESNIIVKDNLSFEVNDEIYLLSLIKSVNNAELISENTKIDTSKIGSKEIKVKYKTKKTIKEYTFSIIIKDTIKPTIEYKKELSTTVGNEIDLTKNVKVTDNSLGEVNLKVEGNYDIKKAGKYILKYIATDSSNNQTEEEFTLIVKNANIKVGGTYYSSGKIVSVTFFKKNKVYVDYDTGCTEDRPCGGYTEYGTYSISDNKVKVKLTHYFNLEPDLDGTKLKKANNLEFTIVNEKQIKLKNQIFNYK